jgi:acyl carrier protein
MPLYPFQRTRHWPDELAREVEHGDGDLRTWLAAELAAIIGETDPTQIDTRRGFADLGMDSIMAAQLAEAIERRCAIELPVMAVFNYPTLEDLAAHLDTLLAKEAYAGQ